MMYDLDVEQPRGLDRSVPLFLVLILCAALGTLPFLTRSLAGSLVTQIFAALVVGLALIDFITWKVPNVVVYPAIAFMAAATALVDLALVPQAALGGLAGLALMLVLAVIGRGKMGMGDVKFGCLVGWGLGWQLGIIALLLGFTLGAIAMLPLLFLKLRSRKDSVPLTPFLAVGAIAATIVFGTVVN